MYDINNGDMSSQDAADRGRNVFSTDAVAEASQSGQQACSETEIKDLIVELEKQKSEVKALTLKCERFKQDFNNYRERIKRNETVTEKQMRQKMNTRLLAVIDALDRAGNFDLDKRRKRESGKILADVRSNIAVIRNKLVSILGMRAIENSPGDMFDGEKHVALDVVKSDKYSDNTIVKVIRKGYLFEGRILRPAEVSISKYTGQPPPVARYTFLHRIWHGIRSFFTK